MQSNWSDWKNRFQALGTTGWSWIMLLRVAENLEAILVKTQVLYLAVQKQGWNSSELKGKVSRSMDRAGNHDQPKKAEPARDSKKFISPGYELRSWGKTEGHWRNSIRAAKSMRWDSEWLVSWLEFTACHILVWGQQSASKSMHRAGPTGGCYPYCRTTVTGVTRDHRDQGTGQLQGWNEGTSRSQRNLMRRQFSDLVQASSPVSHSGEVIQHSWAPASCRSFWWSTLWAGARRAAAQLKLCSEPSHG